MTKTREKKYHPAKFSPEILNVIAEVIEEERPGKKLRIIDPMAGVGGVHHLRNFGHKTIGYEIEPEWAKQSAGTVTANIFHIRRGKQKRFNCMVVSTCYGNRYADKHNAKDKSTRHSYKHDLGRMPTQGSSATMQWGKEFRKFHRRWIRRMLDHWLAPKALIILNISNHIRDHEEMFVSEWFTKLLIKNDCRLLQIIPVKDTKRMKKGENRDARTDREFVLVFEAP